jgi:hypothetical protein
VDKKDTRIEQFFCGLATAVAAKLWIIIISNLMRHTKRERIYSESYNSYYARRMVKFNTIRYWVGVALAISTISKTSFLIL